MVDVAVLGADAAAREPADDLLVGGLDQEDRGESPAAPLEGVLEHLGLADRAGEAVQQEAVVGLVHLGHHHLADELVRHQLAVVHVGLGLLAERGLVLHGLPEDVAGGEIGQVEVGHEALGLCALSGPRGPDEDEVQLAWHGTSARPRRELRKAT